MNYRDMLHLNRPPSAHPKMKRQDRAKIFSPFAALTGYDAAVHARDRVLVPRTVLTDYGLECLEQTLRQFHRGDTASVTYFAPLDPAQPESLGEYVTVTDAMVRLDLCGRMLHLTGHTIPLDDILDLQRGPDPA